MVLQVRQVQLERLAQMGRQALLDQPERLAQTAPLALQVQQAQLVLAQLVQQVRPEIRGPQAQLVQQVRLALVVAATPLRVAAPISFFTTTTMLSRPTTRSRLQRRQALALLLARH